MVTAQEPIDLLDIIAADSLREFKIFVSCNQSAQVWDF